MDVVKAMEHMGRFYLEGDKQIRNLALALQWFGAAAERGSVPSQHQVGIMLRDGLGQPADPLSARSWFEAAASQGYVKAYYPLAKFLLQCSTQPKNRYVD